MEKYIPKSVDTSGIELEKSLIDLQEQLSRNIHEVWSQERLDNGWVYGGRRDDVNKQHPCLVPYDELSENDKKYDRNSVLETLKLTLKLGYTITAPNTVILSEHEKLVVDHQLNSILDCSLLLPELISLWREHNYTSWQSEPNIYYQLGLCFLKSSEPLLAYDVFSEGLECFLDPVNLTDVNQRLYIHINQQQALALAETGAVKEASIILNNLYAISKEVDSATLGLLGRTYKEMALSEGVNGKEKKEYLKKSFECYFTAFETSLKNKNKNKNNAYYNGINAATIALLQGEAEQSIKIANQVTTICNQIIDESERNSIDVMYWVYATLGEAALLLGDIESAKSFYQSAIVKVGKDMRGKNSMHKQVEKILSFKNIEFDMFDELFKKPRVIVFSGHMIDVPGVKVARFPANRENFVRNEIKNQLSKYEDCIAYSSAACGSDILFLEEVVSKGGEINIILPHDIERFKKHSVNTVLEGNWGDRFDVLLNKASRVVILSQYNDVTNEPAYDFTNRFVLGIAVARAKVINSEVEYLSIWNGVTNNNIGGTSSVIDLWSRENPSITVIDPVNGVREITLHENKFLPSLIECKLSSYGTDVGYYNFLPLLFADVKGYSKLNEKQLVTFSTVFLKYISEVFEKYNEGILIKRTQGDGLFIVFNSLNIAAECANEIKNIIVATQWQEYGLPEDLTIRISLDAGPVYSYIEPVTKNLELCGDYVNRAARMEPITPPGYIYASETFTAMANVEKLSDFNFAYAGQVVLPKGHGIIPAYHMYKK